MVTMLYDADTLKPQLLISEDIENGDVGKKFWVINGCWDGTFNADSIVIHHPYYEDYIPSTVYKCYKFKSKPPDIIHSLYQIWMLNSLILIVVLSYHYVVIINYLFVVMILNC